MKRFFYIPSALLLALLAAVLLNAAASQACAVRWCGALENAQAAAQAEDWPTVRAQLAAVAEDWDENSVYFHIILQHDVLNEAESLLLRAESYALAQDGAEFHACTAELIAHFRLLAEMQQLSLPNIL